MLRDFPFLQASLVAVFAQFGSLGNVPGMSIEERGERAQFNVLLDPLSGRELVGVLQDAAIPFVLAPTDVTRVSAIGFGAPQMIEALLKNTNLGFLELARQRRIWFENAIKPRRGEVILTHDMATLFLFLQLTGQCEPIYDLVPVSITEVITEGTEQGSIFFDMGVPSNVFVATNVINHGEYLKLLNWHLRVKAIEVPEHVFLSTSLSISDMADEEYMIFYRERILAQILPLLEEGSVVLHFGSHPSVLDLFNHLAPLYPNQIVQHLLTRFVSSRIDALDDSQVILYESLNELMAGLVSNKSIGIFAAGRTDIDSTISGRSGVMTEFMLFKALNPRGIERFVMELGGMASLAALESAFSVISSVLPDRDSWIDFNEMLVKADGR